MSADITYIDLSQNNSNSINQNGDYEINIDQAITLREGDQITMYKSFIDTQLQQSENIIIEDDLFLTMSFIPYMKNWFPASEQDTYYLNGANLDNIEYIACTTGKDNPSVKGVTILQMSYGEILNAENGLKANHPVQSTPFASTIEYEDVHGNVLQASIPFPSITLNDTSADNNLNSVPVSIRASGRPGTIKDITPLDYIYKALLFTPDAIEKNKKSVIPGPIKGTFTIDGDPDPTPPPLEEDQHLSPLIQTKEFGLKKGNYTPTGIAQAITTALTAIPEGGFSQVPVVPPFLTTPDFLGCESKASDSNVVFVDNQTGKKIWLPVSKKATPVSYVCGASQVALVYDVNDGLFSFEFLHTPFYVGNPGTVKSLGMAFVRKDDNTYGTVNKYGGICLTALNAYKINPDNSLTYVDFWSGILQFDLPSILVYPAHVTPFGYTDTDGTTLIQASSTRLSPVLVDGQNMTGNIITLDNTIDKTSDKPFVYTELSGDIGGISLPQQVNATFGILSQFPYDFNPTFDTPYYKIEVTSKFNTHLVGEKELFRNVLAIQGRYYEVNSYNTGTSSDSFIYEHRGQPITLSNFKIRILNDNNVVPPRLGESNSVFLQVVRAIPSQQPAQQQQDGEKQEKK